MPRRRPSAPRPPRARVPAAPAAAPRAAAGLPALVASLALPLAVPLAVPLAAALPARPAAAQEVRPPAPRFDSGRLLGTAGVSTLEGAAGGGLVPWSVIAGYGTGDSVGAAAHATGVFLPSYTLRTAGAALGLYDRLELSYAHHAFDTRSTGRALGLGEGYAFHQDVLGAKLRLFGNAVYDQDRWLPQVSIGLQHKRNDRGDVLRAVGARSDHGTDFYVAATRLVLDQGLLLNGTVRMTRANQLGILGFGGDRDGGYRPQFEASAAYLVNRRVAVGGEYRMKPDNLSFAREDDWADAFVALFLGKNASLTLAYAHLGRIATRERQNGLFLSLQVGF